MSVDLGRRLLAAGALQPGELQRALFEAIARERPLARALAEVSVTARDLLSRPLRALAVAPGTQPDAHPVMHAVVPDAELAAELPPGLMARLLSVPVRRDPRTRTVDVAVVDPDDAHVVAEISFHLRAPVRAIAAPLHEIERALLLVDAPVPATTAELEAPPVTSSERDVPSEDELALPLVRRARPSDARVSHVEPARPRERASLAPPTTSPYEEPRPGDGQRVQMVVDFSAASRKEREEAPDTRRGTPPLPPSALVQPKQPPFASLTPVLEALDVCRDRDALLAALLRGLSTTAACAALLAPRRGRFVGVGAAGALSPDHVRGTSVPLGFALAEAIARGERFGAIDPERDRELHSLLALDRLGAHHVLVQPAFVADKVALLLVAFGTTDVLEAARRARVLATAASTALSRLLRR